MQISIKILGQLFGYNIISLECGQHDTIQQLKQRIETKFMIPLSYQYMFYNDELLQDELTLSEYCISENCMIILRLYLRKRENIMQYLL